MFLFLVRQRRKSRGEEDEEDEIIEDPKIKREIEELSKFKEESGIGKVICKELEEAKALPMKLLDPWKASRVPNADHEPKFHTRFQSPMFACKCRKVIQWITSCHKNHMTTCYITIRRERVTL